MRVFYEYTNYEIVLRVYTDHLVSYPEKPAFYPIYLTRDMVLSEKETGDRQKLKNGIIGVIVLLALGTLTPAIIEEVTGVDVATLCEEDAEGNTVCPEGGLGTDIVTDALGYVSIVVAVIGFIMMVIVAIKY